MAKDKLRHTKKISELINKLSELEGEHRPNTGWLSENGLHTMSAAEREFVQKVDIIYTAMAADKTFEPRADAFAKIQKRIAFGEHVRDGLPWWESIRNLVAMRWAVIPAGGLAAAVLALALWPTAQPAILQEVAEGQLRPLKVARDTIATGAQARTLKVFDGFLFLNPESRVSVLASHSNNDPDNPQQNIVLSLDAGTLAYSGAKLKKGQTLSFFVGGMEFGVKGTRFIIASQKDGQAQVHVTEGVVEASYHPVDSRGELIERLQKRISGQSSGKDSGPVQKYYVAPGNSLDVTPELTSYSKKPAQDFATLKIRQSNAAEIQLVEEAYAKGLEKMPEHLVLESNYHTDAQARAIENAAIVQTGDLPNLARDEQAMVKDLRQQNRAAALAAGVDPVRAPAEIPPPTQEQSGPASDLTVIQKAILTHQLMPGDWVEVRTNSGSKVVGQIQAVDKSALSLKTDFGPYTVSSSAVLSIKKAK